MDMGNAFPSKYVKATDITGPVKLTVDRVASETIGQGPQAKQGYVLYFRGKQKGLVLNKTKCNALIGAFGRNSESWAGKQVLLYPATAQFQGQSVASIGLTPQQGGAPAPANLAEPAAVGTPDEGGGDFNDDGAGEEDIPF